MGDAEYLALRLIKEKAALLERFFFVAESLYSLFLASRCYLLCRSSNLFGLLGGLYDLALGTCNYFFLIHVL